MARSDTDVQCLQKLRLLGAFEQFSSARHHLGFFNNVATSVTYRHTSEDITDLNEAVFSALSAVILRHPILTCITVDENSTSPYYARLPKINLEDAVTVISRTRENIEDLRDVELDHILQEQHNIPFKERHGELPFWRLIVLLDPNDKSSFMACFIFHHSLGDGASGMIFHRHFLEALEEGLAPLTTKIIFPLKTELLPNMELLHPLPTPPPSVPVAQRALWSGEKVSLPVTSRFHSIPIPKAKTTRFLERCRAHKTTVTATLLTLIASSIFQNLPRKFTDLTAGIPVNIRHWLPSIITSEDFGVWIDSCSEFYSRSALEPFSWDEARRTKSTITDYLNTDGQRITVGKFKHIPDMRNLFSVKVGKERDSSFDISNVGVMRNNKKRKWQVGRAVFSRSAFASGCVLPIAVVTGADGCMVLGFTWQEGIVEEELVHCVIRSIEQEIEMIATG